ncbi:LysE family translocator [Curvivirga aplysinae]|uniref:LysE family translocator n=1 Tax=Curvivirga aplysinae TaxID=2529852 RepID=UPI0012BB98F1|nr:LysE family translocator [Curvivirga aplysinae]MTI09070.1 LysE family translocator [Curvivirga aplysinae]
MAIDFSSFTNVALLPLANFVFVASVTPGPNNLMLAASGLNFGLQRTVPHAAGVALGFLFMVLMACMGLGQLFTIFPLLQSILTYAGSAYLLYLAYRIGTAAGVGKVESKAKPLTFIEAALFQWINPKAWMMAVTFSSAFGLQSDNLANDAAVTLLVVLFFGVPCILIWTSFGSALRRWMKDEKHLRIFNYIMATLIVATVPFMLMG